MRPIYWKLALVTAVGLALGTFGGQATIAGLAPPVVRQTADRGDAPPAEAGPEASRYADSDPAMADYARIADECDGCSDYDLGYRFAASRRIATTADCMDCSWSYQRGCIAFLRKG